MLGDLPRRRAGVDQAPVASFDHAPQHQPREVEGSVEVDLHRLAPDLRILLPDHPLVGGADTVIADEDVDRSQAALGFRNGKRATLGRAEICDRVLETERPMPRPAPVTSAIRPSTPAMLSLPLLRSKLRDVLLCLPQFTCRQRVLHPITVRSACFILMPSYSMIIVFKWVGDITLELGEMAATALIKGTMFLAMAAS